LARLTLLEATVGVAALAVDDAHHLAAATALGGTAADALVLAATTRAEILIGPARVGGGALESARAFVDGCATVPVTADIADAAATLRARERALSLPDAITLIVANVIGADTIWTFDRRWRSVDPRVAVP
jgi:predicted nucleic acid-binding protein